MSSRIASFRMLKNKYKLSRKSISISFINASGNVFKYFAK